MNSIEKKFKEAVSSGRFYIGVINNEKDIKKARRGPRHWTKQWPVWLGWIAVGLAIGWGLTRGL